MIIGGIKASRYIKANREATVQSLMDLLKSDRAAAAATYDYLNKTINNDGSPTETGFKLMMEDVKQSAKVNRDIPVSDVADFLVLHEAQRELGITVK